jgi:VIT1/CCC1 family predicted Fe2+/Mn2+ transporter
VEDFPHVAFATAFVLGVYWLAHVYTEAQSLQFAGDRRSFWRRLAHTAVGASDIIKGGLPAIAVYLAVDLLGASTKNAAATAVYFSVAVLGYVGYLTARRSGRHGWASLADALVAGLFGVLVVLAKTLLH